MSVQQAERTEADRLFTGLLLGTMISVPLNVAFSVLWHSSPSISQAVNEFCPVNDILGKVRRDGKYYSLKSFVTPNEPLIREEAAILYQGGNFIRDAQDFVHSTVKYKSEGGDFWKLPVDTLTDGYGDCEDSALVLASLLLNYMTPEEIWVVAGEWEGDGHCWVTVDSRILESTASSKMLVKQSEYKPQVFFNDKYAWAGPSDFDFIIVAERYHFALI